jgi:ribosomal protein L37AE/L43A
MKKPPGLIAIPLQNETQDHLSVKCPNCQNKILPNDEVAPGMVVCSSCDWSATFKGIAKKHALFTVTPAHIFSQVFTPEKTNQTPEASVRDIEREIIASAIPPKNLIEIPVEQRADCDQFSVVVPGDIQNYLNNAEYPLSADEVNMLEDRIMAHHNVEDPACIALCPSFAKSGKAWRFLPEVGKYETGFIYLHA